MGALRPLPLPRGEAGERKPKGQRPPLLASPWKGEVAPQGPEGALALCFPAAAGGLGTEKFLPLRFSGIPPEGLSGPAPTGGLLSCANKKVTKEIARGPLPAPWTPGAVVPDLQPLLAFNFEPSSGLSAAWVDTRRPPPFGSAESRGRGLGVLLLRRVASGG